MNKDHMVKLSSLLLAAWLCACAAKVDNRGYAGNGDIKSQLTVGQTSREDVLAALGSPSARGSFGDETWYYISSRKEATAFFKPEIVKQDVTRIEFDSAGLVSHVENFDKEDGQDIQMAKRVTPTEGHELGFVEQLLGNIGRFNTPGRQPTAGPGGVR